MSLILSDSPPTSSSLGKAPPWLEEAAAVLEKHASASFIRYPVPGQPRTPADDLDIVAFGAVEELLVERRWLNTPTAPSLDIIWLPAGWLTDAPRLASYGLITHRLLQSQPWPVSERAQRVLEQVHRLHRRPEHQEARLSGFFDMARLTVREIGVTWDCPALALFWLQMAWAAAGAALLDGMGALCPNIYTRPLTYMRQLERLCGESLVEPMVACLHLNDDLDELEIKLRELQRVTQVGPEPAWPVVIRPAARAEYRYWQQAAEVEERLRTARTLAAQGAGEEAVWYVRFCAYSLARLPLMRQHAQDGTPTAFGRPARAMHPALAATCPEAAPLLERILRGAVPLSGDVVHHGLQHLGSLRQLVERWLCQQGIDLTTCPPWLPYTQLI